MRSLKFAAVILMIALFCSPAFSQYSPLRISYQALVLGNDGKPVEAERAPVSLALIDATTGATVWSDAVEADIHDGVLNLALGSHTPLPSPQSLDRPLKLQIGL